MLWENSAQICKYTKWTKVKKVLPTGFPFRQCPCHEAPRAWFMLTYGDFTISFPVFL